ncbi:unnamed protein product [Urochloa decumbens]|uniref:ShKT domain-containing protein n=2 Tax=Urochloa decumbens TaxID=240449 RepID=A0ABC9HA81_9POAL
MRKTSTMMTIFLFATLFGSTLLAQCRPNVLDVKGSVASDVNYGPFDETKVSITFCVHARCNYFNPGWDDCFCCPTTDLKEYCHLTMDECRASCTSCKPKC